jgi:hypothetical protein
MRERIVRERARVEGVIGTVKSPLYGDSTNHEPAAQRRWPGADRYVELVPKSTSTGEALAYCLVEWEAFIRFMEDGALEVDNGEVERRIKHFAVGRSNWNFCDSKAGAEASMILYTVLESAKASGQEPLAYLTEVLKRMPHAHTMAEIEQLLPWNLDAPTPH